jgi:hypothetical protein
MIFDESLDDMCLWTQICYERILHRPLTFGLEILSNKQIIFHPHEEGREGKEGDLVFGVDDDDIEFAAKPNSLW